jgi:cobalt-zinc-cadmium resistance protein CzcA
MIAPSLVDRTIATVEKNLFEGAILVVVVLLAARQLAGRAHRLAGHPALVPVSPSPAWCKFGVSGNLMSLGAVDFGLIIDGAVVMVENIVRRLGCGSTSCIAS